MVNKILTEAGFELNKTYKQTRFLKPPQTTYAIYEDTVNRRGADDVNLITDHDVNIELYEYTPDADAEKRLEAVFDKLGIEYIKQARYWIDNEQIYQLIYEFSYTEK